MMVAIRWKQRFKDFKKALKRLEEALQKESFEELEKDGVIQRFEFTFELAWKTLQDFLFSQGYENIRGPKKVIQQAFSDKYIQEGHDWIDMLEDRNKITHLYDQSMSEKIFQNIKNKYALILRDLVSTLNQE